MENAEEIFHFLDDFSKRKPKTIPQELNEYLAYVARTGDPVYQWSLVKSLFKEKLLNVITDFYETTPSIEIPPYPNVDPFNYDIMKNSLLERLDSFTSAPFTVQRLCELLTFPRKQYNRIDKFMRAIEKNILVVSTREPGIQRHSETENGEANEPIVNGSDNSEYHVDVEMDDMSRKENNEHWVNEPQPGSSDTHISVDDIEARLKAKENNLMDSENKSTEYEAVTPPELNVNTDDSAELKPKEISPKSESELAEKDKEDTSSTELDIVASTEDKKDVEMMTECASTLVIPEIRVDDAEMTEQKLIEQANTDKQAEVEINMSSSETKISETAVETPQVIDESSSDSKLSESAIETPQVIDESSSDSKVSESAVETPQGIDESSSDSKDETETKLISEVSTSSEESSSSSDNTDGSSNSPKTDEGHIDIQEESNPSDTTVEVREVPKESVTITKDVSPTKPKEASPTKIESENYSISDVQSKLPIEIDFPPIAETKETVADKEESKVTEDKIIVEEKTQDSESEIKES
ncbi:Serine/threonine-protein phosphatase 4 regulatory subunit 2 [Operophtera brumata]|uniref:Serine/threonine-protein phosphatase 4 regulatory subunit 2 n=1 Tax=Operophtera brumata TaxID=104452 RepID=A0A0L7LN42_OPEBR|nr:Serine/threonine-protein phosphatase 4 regulatory subunit 2 [Operophtera brumata]